MKSILKLFKALEIETRNIDKLSTINESILKATIQKGFIFDPIILSFYSEKELLDLTNDIGLTPKQLNSSFHKSWKKVKDASIEQLVFEQILHYITTYGFEALGIYDKDSVYIPYEKLKIPKVKEDKIKLVIIKGYTKEELKAKLMVLLESGIALKEETKNDVIDIALYLGLTDEEIYGIKNKEVKIMLYDFLDIIPKNNVEFIRYLIYKTTDQTLVIKNKDLIDKIKESKNIKALSLIEKYQKKYGLEKLAEIFYRYKPLFLAFRINKKLKIIINKIRRLAKTNHKPIKEDYLNNVTRYIKNNTIDKEKFEKALKDVNIFRKIRLAYSLKYRAKGNKSIVYRIRNGKAFAKKLDNKKNKSIKEYLNILLDSISNDIKENVKEKKIFIPDYIKYALPATEKQFIGNIPCGSYIKLKKDIICGIHWENQDNNRIDLDLSLVSKYRKIGWDSSYRNEDKTVLFSGDITDAPLPNGATELYYVSNDNEESFSLILNYFNYDDRIPVPFTLFLANEKPKNMQKNYIVDPNNIITQIEMNIDIKQKMLGYILTGKKNRFCFNEMLIGAKISSRNTEYMKLVNDYYNSYFKNTITLNKILKKAGAILVGNNEECDIDLSIENLEKDTIISILNK